NGLALFAELAQQVEILHIPRPDLKDVGVLRNQRDLDLVHHFADDQQTIAIGGGAQKLQAFLAQALEAVRRAARLESAAADHLGAGAGYDFGDALDLVLVLDAARSRHRDDLLAAYIQFADLDDGASRAEAAAGELIRGH